MICRFGDIRDVKGKNKTKGARIFFTFDLFFQLKFFLVFFLKFLNIVCLDQIQKSHSSYKKKLLNLN